MINFQKPQANNKRHIGNITGWVEDALPEGMDDLMVMVNEMTCYEPGCAPLETVVSLLGQRSQVFKIFKPAKDVVAEDVHSGIQNLLSGNARDHLAPAMSTTSDDAMQTAMLCSEEE